MNKEWFISELSIYTFQIYFLLICAAQKEAKIN